MTPVRDLAGDVPVNKYLGPEGEYDPKRVARAAAAVAEREAEIAQEAVDRLKTELDKQ